MCVARSVQPKELGSQLFIDLPSCFVSLSLSLSLSLFAERGSHRGGSQGFPSNLAQGLKKQLGKKRAEEEETPRYREGGRVGER